MYTDDSLSALPARRPTIPYRHGRYVLTHGRRGLHGYDDMELGLSLKKAFKSIAKPIVKVVKKAAPILAPAAAFIPGIGPVAARALKAAGGILAAWQAAKQSAPAEVVYSEPPPGAAYPAYPAAGYAAPGYAGGGFSPQTYGGAPEMQYAAMRDAYGEPAQPGAQIPQWVWPVAALAGVMLLTRR